MATTASVIRSARGVRAWYLMRITGIPIDFVGVIDPYSSEYGADAWTLPAGRQVRRGMATPDTNLTQTLTDIMGGMTEGESMQVRLQDFEERDAGGAYFYLARLFSPGRLAAAGPVPELETRIPASLGPGGTFSFRGAAAGATVGGTNALVYVGEEAIRVSAGVVADAEGRGTLTVAARNQFPCDPSYPPVPAHNVVLMDASGVPGLNIFVSPEPYSMHGRTASFYVGHINEGGYPCTEAEMLRVIVGRIGEFSFGRDGLWSFRIDSVMNSLMTRPIGPDLASTQIKPDQIVVTTATSSFVICALPDGSVTGDVFNVWKRIEVPNGIYSLGELMNEINRQLLAAYFSDSRLVRMSCGLITDNGVQYVAFTPDYSIANWMRLCVRQLSDVGLLTPLGFDKGDHFVPIVNTEWNANTEYKLGDIVFSASANRAYEYIANVPTAGNPLSDGSRWKETNSARPIVATRPAPSVFIPLGPTIGWNTDVPFVVDDPNAAFFNNQGDTGGRAFGRFGDGTIVQVAGQTGQTVVARGWPQVRQQKMSTNTGRGAMPSFPCYRVNLGETATFCQVVLMEMPTTQTPNIGTMLGRVLASTGQMSDDRYDAYPAGVGFGLGDLVDTDAFDGILIADAGRRMYLDFETTFRDVFLSIAQTYGLHIFWDAETGRVSIARVSVPNPGQEKQPQIGTSIKSETGELTEQRTASDGIRSGYTLEWGWDDQEKKFMAPTMNMPDRWVRSAFGQFAKTSKISDRSLLYSSERDQSTGLLILGRMIERSYLMRNPWARLDMSVTKSALVMSPVDVHRIVDGTVWHPFIGGRLGVEYADRVFGLVMSVTRNPGTGLGSVSVLMNKSDPAGQFLVLSPCALLDYDATGHGYNPATGVCTVVSHYASDGASFDGVDFRVGDEVFLIGEESAAGYMESTTVTAVAGDGHTVTVAAGLPALPDGQNYNLILRRYTESTAQRKQDITYQSNEDGRIQAVANAERWS